MDILVQPFLGFVKNLIAPILWGFLITLRDKALLKERTSWSNLLLIKRESGTLRDGHPETSYLMPYLIINFFNWMLMDDQLSSDFGTMKLKSNLPRYYGRIP